MKILILGLSLLPLWAVASGKFDCEAKSVVFSSQKTTTSKLVSNDGVVYQAQAGDFDYQFGIDPDGYGYNLEIRTISGNVAVAKGSGFFDTTKPEAPLYLFGRTTKGSASLYCYK